MHHQLLMPKICRMALIFAISELIQVASQGTIWEKLCCVFQHLTGISTLLLQIYVSNNLLPWFLVGVKEYHVQFFGSVPERAWIHEKRTVVYKGENQFEELQAETLRKATNPTEKQKVSCCTSNVMTVFLWTFLITYSVVY